MVERQHEGLAEKRISFRQEDAPGFGEYVQLLHASYSNLVLLVCHVAHHAHFGRKVNIREVTGNEEREVAMSTRERLERLIKEARALGLSAVAEKYYSNLRPLQPSGSKNITAAQLLGEADKEASKVEDPLRSTSEQSD